MGAVLSPAAVEMAGASLRLRRERRQALGQLDAVALAESCGFAPDPWQADVLRSTAQRLILNVTRQGGKALHAETPIRTAAGWTTMGALSPGERVYDEQGQPCVVEWCSPITLRAVSRVHFSDGSELVADDDHLWTTLDAAARGVLSKHQAGIPDDWAEWRTVGTLRAQASVAAAPCSFGGCVNGALALSFCPGHYRQSRLGVPLVPLRYRSVGAQTVSTREMAATLHSGRRVDTNHSIPTARPLERPWALLPIDPYVLGAWLGDGESAGARITITEADRAIISEIEAAGHRVVRHGATSERTPNWGIRGLQVPLRQMQMLGHKHIPRIYLDASQPQRVALLQGLMDTDGSAARDKNVCEFTTTSERLAHDFYELATGLGLMVRMREARATLYGRDVGPKWRLVFCPWFQPFRLPRKMARLSFDGPRQGLRRLRYVTSVESAGVAPVRCIAVSSPSKLYLAGTALVPTHNSTITSILALHTALYQAPALVLLLSPSLRQSQELFRKVLDAYRAIEGSEPSEAESALRLEMTNGSRIIALPGKEGTIRGYSGVTLLVLDEASRIADGLYYSIRPMLAVSGGRLVMLSTPFGKRGVFHQEWTAGEDWHRVEITAEQCPRIAPAFLAEEQATLPRWVYQQEYCCEFVDTEDSVFAFEDIQAALSADVVPLFGDGAL